MFARKRDSTEPGVLRDVNEIGSTSALRQHREERLGCVDLITSYRAWTLTGVVASGHAFAQKRD
jgi:hypothetical protein